MLSGPDGAHTIPVMAFCKHVGIVAALLLVAGRPTFAQWKVEEDPSFQVVDVEVKPIPERFALGKGAHFHGRVDTQGVGFRLGGLGMLIPVAVTLLVPDPSRPVKLALGKEWNVPERSTETGPAGGCTELFRTDDAVQIRVFSPAEPRRFDLIIWVGEERTDYPDMPSAIDFGQADRAAARNSSNAPSLPASPANGGPPGTTGAFPTPGDDPPVALWVIAGLLGALVVMAGVALLRRRSPT